MSRFKNILLPTDLHHNDLHTIRYGRGLTGEGGNLYILHVGDKQESTPFGQTVEEAMGLLRERATALGLKTELVFREGDLMEQVLAVEREVRADIVCVSASRHTGVDRLIIPTHYGKIVRQSPLPVLVVMAPPAELDESQDATRIQRIMCPQDDTEFSRAALPLAADLCTQYGAELLVLNVHSPLKPDDREGHAKHEQLKQDLLASTNKYADVKAKVLILEEKNPMWAIVDTADKEQIDLVVLPTHGRSALSQIWHASTAESVAPRLICPLITIRPDLMKGGYQV